MMFSLKQSFQHPFVRRYRALIALVALLTIGTPVSVAVSNIVMDAPLFWWPSTEAASSALLLAAAKDGCARERLLAGKASLEAHVSRFDEQSNRSRVGITAGKVWTVSDVAVVRYRCDRDTKAAAERARVGAARAAAERLDADRASQQRRVIESVGSARAVTPQG